MLLAQVFCCAMGESW